MEKNSSKINNFSVQGEERTNNRIEDGNSRTPVNSRTTTEINEYYSPLFSQCTQEENDNIDVMWDWNSPQSKPRIRKQKRIHIQQSPKFPIKRHPSNNQIPAFDKLKEDLETLRDQIITEHSKINSNASLPNTQHNPKEHQINSQNLSDLEDIFNDSMEEQLIRCSQEAEHNSNKFTDNSPNQKLPKDIDKNFSLEKQLPVFHNSPTNAIANKEISNDTGFECLNTSDKKIADDSFDYLLGTIRDEDLPIDSEHLNNTRIQSNSTNTQNKETVNIQKNCSANAIKVANVPVHNQILNNTSQCTPTEIQNKDKVKSSYEIKNTVAKCTAQEIERKRKEALAKLETRKKQNSCESESPIKCSPEEIEKKRLKALAKLEEKKKQEIIEQKRREALKRLEMSKKRRALQAQTVLSKT